MISNIHNPNVDKTIFDIYNPDIDLLISERDVSIYNIYRKRYVSISDLATLLHFGRNQTSFIVHNAIYAEKINIRKKGIRTQNGKYYIPDLNEVLGIISRFMIAYGYDAVDEYKYINKLKSKYCLDKIAYESIKQIERKLTKLMSESKKISVNSISVNWDEANITRLKIKYFIYSKPYISIQEFAYIMDIDEKKASTLLQDAINGGESNPNLLPLRRICSKYCLLDLSKIFDFETDIVDTKIAYELMNFPPSDE
ncbi:hypothetical protein [Faecalitalea cylindroides]|uniref:hypothetical protein n=1 Tax=Faecalitalea cylindroides TaxID=39483 RepID=UPI000B37AC6A|nr:hypothetical protein [Faecalitalea cylindroides]OUN63723.1 hypothetical protein B5G15_01130 [Faecalitalea cylindroides]